jgi:hypothetical protein
MHLLIRASGLVVALAVAAPALAQQSPMVTSHTTKHTARISKRSPEAAGLQAGYMKACGAHFRCYNRIPLDCADNTRPFQNIAEHQCLCVRDGCPQNGM